MRTESRLRAVLVLITRLAVPLSSLLLPQSFSPLLTLKYSLNDDRIITILDDRWARNAERIALQQPEYRERTV